MNTTDKMAKARAARKAGKGARRKFKRDIPPEAYSTRLKTMPERYKPLYFTVISSAGSPKSAIKAFCLECVGWNPDEVRNCQGYACPLYMHRPYKLESEIRDWSRSVSKETQ